MKKVLSILLLMTLALALSACGQEKTTGESDGQISVKSPVDLLDAVWASYDNEEDKFPAAGGDIDNTNMEGPGKFGLDDPAALDSTLGFPAAEVDKIDGAASLLHMMNANTFTCGVFHTKDAGGISALAGQLKDNIMGRQWMCGFPDKLIIVKVDSYIVSFFGNTQIVDTFSSKLTTVYPSGEVLFDEPIV